MSQQDFVKNNDKPSADSVLWEFADDWKTSQQTGLSYASMPAFERKDADLYEGLRGVIKSKKIEDVEYQSYFFVPTLFPNKDKSQKDPKVISNWHVFVYDNAADAKKKAESVNRFTKWDVAPPVPEAPKPKAPETGVKVLNEKKPEPAQPKEQHIKAPIVSQPDSPLLTFTDLQIVDIEQAKILESNGYCFIPSTLLKDNHWKEDVYDENEQIIGSKHMFVLGRIINVKIADN